MHLNNELLFLKYCKPHFKKGLKVLEIGPQGNPSSYQKLADVVAEDWYSLDIVEGFAGNDNPHFIYSSDEYNYPIEDNSFDIVFSGGVMCNVKEVWTWMAELKRIVKPGGLILTLTPISWPYADAPVDCWRVYPEGMKAINNFVGLETLYCEFESLELAHFGVSESFIAKPNVKIPYVSIAGYDYGKTMTGSNKRKLFFNKIMCTIPLVRRWMNPGHVSVDTVCIAKKP